MIAPINKIIHSSFVDGPGNRTSIFFQGCNLNCVYCHNPETINICNACGDCLKVCKSSALNIENSKMYYDKKECIECDECIKVCKYNSSPKISWLTEEDVYKIVLENKDFIRGITCSGGECTIYSEFLVNLFTLIKAQGLTCLIDTNGAYIDFSKHPELVKVTDGVMLDIKTVDDKKHIKLIGSNSHLVLKNAEYLASVGKLLEIRTVICENEFDNEKTVLSVLNLLKKYDLKNTTYKLIKYRHYGVRKEFEQLGTPSDEYMQKLKRLAENLKIGQVIII